MSRSDRRPMQRRRSQAYAGLPVDRWRAGDVPANWFLMLVDDPDPVLVDDGGWSERAQVVLFTRKLDAAWDRFKGRAGPQWKWWEL